MSRKLPTEKELKAKFKELVEIQVKMRKYTKHENIEPKKEEMKEYMATVVKNLDTLSSRKTEKGFEWLMESIPVFYQFFREVQEEWSFLDEPSYTLPK